NDKDYGSGYLVKKSSFHNELNIDPDIYPDVGIINPIQVSNPKQEFFFSQFSYIFYPFYSNEKISFENYKQGIGVPNSAIQRLKDNSDIYKITTLQNLYNTAGNETYVEFSKAVTYNSYNDNLDNLFIGGSKVNYEEIPYVALLDMYGAAVPGEGNPMSPFGWLWDISYNTVSNMIYGIGLYEGKLVDQRKNVNNKLLELQELYKEFNASLIKKGLCSPSPVMYGEFGYYESKERYPCNKEIWGDLAGKPIRHHRFPKRDIHDNMGNIYTLGIRFDLDEIKDIIKNSTKLTQEEKDDIVGFKILRGNRRNNKSVIAKGLINNVGVYSDEKGRTRYYPNYPYNDLRADPFLSIGQTEDDSGKNIGLQLNGFTNPDEYQRRFTFHSPDTSFYQP
ncbi:MAG TPA: hypothetical protein VK031_03410, partial [Tissierellaceae bacterium]|nr:hypothetical protein [Tissierellaceae bacterium]